MIYGTKISEHNLGKWGTVRFAQWLHPNEQWKSFTERDIDWMANFVKPGGIAVDVGAFTGDTALPMAVAAGKTGAVIAFEPNPASLSVLMENSTLNTDIAQMTVIPYAVGLRSEKRIFRYHCEQINGGFLTDGEPLVVKSVRLDEIGIDDPLSFVKFDTEGEDGCLLTEYGPWLKEHGNPVVQVERYPTLSELQKAVLWNAITSYGVPSIKDDWSFTQLKQLPEGLVDIVIRPI